MSQFSSPVPLPKIPDDLTIPQFIFRSGGVHESPSRPVRPSNVPFFIEDRTGRGILYEEVCCTHRLSNTSTGVIIKARPVALGPPPYIRSGKCTKHQVEDWCVLLALWRVFLWDACHLLGPKDVGSFYSLLSRLRRRNWSPRIVCLFSPNHIGCASSTSTRPWLTAITVICIDYATIVWAVHTLGGIITWVLTKIWNRSIQRVTSCILAQQTQHIQQKS